MELPFDKIAERVDTRTLATQLLPSFFFALALGALLGARFGWEELMRWAADLDEVEAGAIAVLATSAWLLLASLLALATRPLIRLYEGYWGDSLAAQWLRGRGEAREAARRARLRSTTGQASYAERYHTLPATADAGLLPTRFGNTMLAAESYSGDDERYGMDSVFFWPRLYFVIPETVRQAIGQARGEIERLVVSSALAALLALVALGFCLDGRTPRALSLAVAVGAALLSVLCYQGALRGAVTFGEILRAAFDLYRRDLLIQLGVQPPATLQEERALWRALGQQLYRRGADEPELIRFTVPPGASTKEGGDPPAGKQE